MLVDRVDGMRRGKLGGLFALLTFLLVMLSSVVYSSEALANHEGSSGGGSQQKQQKQQQRPVDRLIQQQVGEFQLQQIKSSQNGASDARNMLYESPDGVKIGHSIAAFRSSGEVRAAQKGALDGSLSDGFEVQQRFTVNDSDGRQVGSGIVVVKGDEEEVHWTNGNLVAVIRAPAGEGAGFYTELKYY